MTNRRNSFLLDARRRGEDSMGVGVRWEREGAGSEHFHIYSLSKHIVYISLHIICIYTTLWNIYIYI